jgi:hypothetical protein
VQWPFSGGLAALVLSKANPTAFTLFTLKKRLERSVGHVFHREYAAVAAM